MSIFYKNKDGEIRKIATNLTQRVNARWFLCTRVMEDGQEYYDVPEDQTLNYFTSISPFTIYAFGFNEPNTTRTPKLRYKDITYNIADVTNIQSTDLGIGQLQGVFQMFTQESETDRTIYFVGDMHQDYQKPNEDISRVLEIGLDGIIESGKVNFTVKDSEAFDPFKTNLREFLMSAYLPIVLADIEDLDTTMEVVITFGDTVYYMYNYLTGADVHLTIGDLLSVASYDQTKGFYFHFKSVFFETSELVGFAVIPPAITPKQLEQLIEDNDSIITELNSDGDRLSIHLSADIVSKLARMLVTPMSRPISTELVAIDNTGTQTMLELGDGLLIEDGKLKATAQGGGGGGADIKVDDALSETSENPVQNKVITSYLTHVGTSVGQMQEDVERLKQQVNFVNKIYINMANATDLNGLLSLPCVESLNFIVAFPDGTSQEYTTPTTLIQHQFTNTSQAGWIFIYGDWNGIAYDSDSSARAYVIEQVIYDNNITNIPSMAFRYTSNLLSIILPNSILEIGKEAFYKSSLQDIVLPNQLQEIGTQALAYTQLTKLILPKSLTSMGDLIIQNTPITKLVFSDGMNAYFPLRGNTTLKELIVPANAPYAGTTVNYRNGYGVLEKVTLLGTAIPRTSSSSFEDVSTFLVPYSALLNYKTGTNWTSHANKIYPIGGNYSETITIPSSTWDTTTNTATVEAVGATSEARNVITWFTSSGGSQVENTYGLKCTAQGTMQLTFSCETIPTEDIEVSVSYMLTNY